MSFFHALDVSASGLTAQRLRMDIIAENMANVDTTRTENGTPYKKKAVLFQERGGNTQPFSNYFENALSINSVKQGNGVRVTGITTDNSEGLKVYDPNHPDADEEGYVQGSNVNFVEEMINMISASRSYEANITAMNVTQSMLAKTIELASI